MFFSQEGFRGNPANFGDILGSRWSGPKVAIFSKEFVKKWTLPEPGPDVGIFGSRGRITDHNSRSSPLTLEGAFAFVIALEKCLDSNPTFCPSV